MDRTIIAVQRAEERELSETLFKKLRGLNLVYPPTDDLHKCLNEEMFIKPNPKAFFHVMHYLFCLLDAAEFKRRFYWPITDKRSEANFRTNTVEYLKYINEKHKLQWGDIKSYLVVMPGGKKFITFLLELVAFVVQEQIRHRDKLLGAELEYAHHLADLNLKRMRKQNEFFKDYASAYISNVEEQIEQLCEKTRNLGIIFDFLAKETGLSKAQLCDETFIAEFERSNQHLFQENFVENTSRVCKLEQPLTELKKIIDEFQLKDAVMKYDKRRVREALQKIGDALPTETTDNLDVFLRPNPNSHEDIKLNELVIAFNSIQPALEHAFTEVEQTQICGDLVNVELLALKNDFQQIEAQITDFQMALNTQMKSRSSQRKQISKIMYSNNRENNSLKLKYVCTPPIKMEMMDSGRMDNMRLTLFADTQAKDTNASFCRNISVVPCSTRKPKHQNTSIELNNTLNKSRIIDPMELLRTIHKGTAGAQRQTSHSRPSSSTSMMGARWRERQNLFDNDIQSEPAVPSKNSLKGEYLSSYTNKISDCTTDVDKEPHLNQQRIPTSPSFSSTDQIYIARTQLLEAISSSSGSGSTKAKVLFSRRVSAVQKVQGDSLNIANMSTSPSGRLDALVTPPVDFKETPKLKLNDTTLQENTMYSDKSTKRIADCVQLLEMSTNCVMLAEEASKIIADGENDKNILNTPMRIQPSHDQIEFPVIADNADDLFNISDTVLNDVTI